MRSRYSARVAQEFHNRAVPILLAVLLLVAGDATACPVCDTGTGEQVRAGIMDGDLGLNLLATLLPFTVVLAVVAVIHFGPPWRNKPGRPEDGGEHGD